MEKLPKYVIIPIFLLVENINIVCAQNNLVENFSFEEKVISTNGSNRISAIGGWFAANGLPGDYYYKNNTDASSSVPKNLFGNQEPHSGYAYTGICIEKGFMEYLETNLSSTLIKGEQYQITFFISKADKSKSYINDFGVLFLPKEKRYFLVGGISTKPHIEFTEKDGFKNETEWVELSAIYMAEGWENSIVLGHFLNNDIGGFKGKVHYYIDDISISLYEEDDTISSNLLSDTKTLLDSVIQLGDLNFKLGTADLTKDIDTVLNPILNYLIKQNNCTVIIEGYTDDSGSEEFNLSLSNLRAKAIADYFISHGIDQNRIRHVGRGSSNAIADNTCEEGRAKNRRVVVTVTK